MTRAKEDRPLRREVDGGESGDLIVEIRERTVTIRPKGKRSGRVFYTWGSVYRKLLWADAEFRVRQKEKERKTGRRKRVKRGVL